MSLKDRTGVIEMNQATIEFDGTNYILCATSTEGMRMSLLSNELVNNPTCFSDYIINSSQVLGEKCYYDFSGTILLHTKAESTICGAKYQWAINSFKKVIQSDEKEGFLFYVVSIDKKWRIRGLNTAVEFEYRHNKYLLSQDEDNDILIRTDKDNKYKSMVVSLLSLFQGTAMEIRCKEECKGGEKTISYLPVQYRFSELSPFTNDLNYLEHAALADFKHFMSFSLDIANRYDKTMGNYMVRAIERFIGAKYVDHQTQFIYLVSILEAIAEKVEKIKTTESVIKKDGKGGEKQRTTYEIVSESLIRKNIDLSKLNDTIKESVGLNEFVDLRNEILHRLPTEKIVDYLNYKYPMFYLEFTVCITILHHLGFDNIHFRRGFELSIYNGE